MNAEEANALSSMSRTRVNDASLIRLRQQIDDAIESQANRGNYMVDVVVGSAHPEVIDHLEQEYIKLGYAVTRECEHRGGVTLRFSWYKKV